MDRTTFYTTIEDQVRSDGTHGLLYDHFDSEIVIIIGDRFQRLRSNDSIGDRHLDLRPWRSIGNIHGIVKALLPY